MRFNIRQSLDSSISESKTTQERWADQPFSQEPTRLVGVRAVSVGGRRCAAYPQATARTRELPEKSFPPVETCRI
jgi:hypothetical protein